jgi:hypothetical protein
MYRYAFFKKNVKEKQEEKETERKKFKCEKMEISQGNSPHSYL